MKVVFINPERCVGCKQCQIACAVEHSSSRNLYGALYEDPRPRPRILVSPGPYLNLALPNKCRHCDPAPCLLSCPTGAIFRDPDTDLVLIDHHKCITCAMCAMVCPFDALTFYPLASDPERPVAIKCDQCVSRLKDGREPACVEACKVGALEFGEINELIRKARTRLALRISFAAGEFRPEMAHLPRTYEAWQRWGEAVGEINKR